MILKIKRLTKEAILPSRGTEDSAGLDMCVTEPVTLVPGETKLCKTGIAMEIPQGMYGMIRPRSSTFKKGIHTQGVIDADYRGEVHLVLVNLSRNAVTIPPGTAVGQIIIQKFERLAVEEVVDLSDTKRGTGGYGSTGNALK
jgi:dUTP pyrophosphatase